MDWGLWDSMVDGKLHWVHVIVDGRTVWSKPVILGNRTGAEGEPVIWHSTADCRFGPMRVNRAVAGDRGEIILYGHHVDDGQEVQVVVEAAGEGAPGVVQGYFFPLAASSADAS